MKIEDSPTTETIELENQKVKIFTHDYYGFTVRVLETDDGQSWANIDEFTHALENMQTKH